MAEPMLKEQAHEMVDQMPEGSTWDDLIREVYVRQAIEQGLADSKAGRTADVVDVRKRYGLDAICRHIALDSPAYAERMVERLTH